MKKRKTHPVSYVAMKSKGYVLLFLACLIFSPLSASQPWRENRFAFPLPTVARTSSGLPASPSRAGHESPPCDQRGIPSYVPGKDQLGSGNAFSFRRGGLFLYLDEEHEISTRPSLARPGKEDHPHRVRCPALSSRSLLNLYLSDSRPVCFGTSGWQCEGIWIKTV